MNRERTRIWLRIACWIGAIAALLVAFWCVIGFIFVSIFERELGLGAYSAILCVLLFSGLYVCRSEYRAVYCQQIIKPSPWLKIALGIVLIVGNFHALLFQVFNAVMCWRIYVALKQIFSSEFPLFEVKNAVVEVFASSLIFICVLCVLVAINVISIDVIRRLSTADSTNLSPNPSI